MRSAALRKSAFSLLKAISIWVQVGRIRRQINQIRTYRFNRLPDAGNFMHRQIVRDDDIAALERS